MVLASSSTYLNAQLENNSDPIKQTFLEDLNEAAVLAMIEFCYTGIIGNYFYVCLLFRLEKC